MKLCLSQRPGGLSMCSRKAQLLAQAWLHCKGLFVGSPVALLPLCQENEPWRAAPYSEDRSLSSFPPWLWASPFTEL